MVSLTKTRISIHNWYINNIIDILTNIARFLYPYGQSKRACLLTRAALKAKLLKESPHQDNRARPPRERLERGLKCGRSPAP